MSSEEATASNREIKANHRAGVLASWCGALAMTVALAACDTAPVKPTPTAAPAITSLQEYMQQASKASAEGSREKARDTYRAAAKAYPASNEPWSRLAEDYFAASDYGNAILAAQEVLLRDANDTVAASVLAVSGLRVSASALQTLRVQNKIAGDTRTEAQTMTKTLRDVLGEDVLVPRPAAAASAPKPRSSTPRPHAAAPPVRPADTAAPAVAPSAAPKNPGSPFDKLLK